MFHVHNSGTPLHARPLRFGFPAASPEIPVETKA